LKRSRENHPIPVVKMPNTIVVGRDMRPHSPPLAKALADGIRSVGVDVIDVGMIDTSFIYFAINHLDAVGGIMTTASHNPIQYNGFKISGPKAKPIGSATGLDDIKRIASQLRTPNQSGLKTGLKGKYEEQDLWAAYRKHVHQFLDLKRPENKGSTIVYDLRSSHSVPDTIKALGGVPKRDRVGHAFIKKTMAETKAVFGGELSGHLYFRDNFFADSAAVAFACVLSVVSAQDKPLGELMRKYYKYSHSGEINFHVEDKDAKIRE